MEDTEKVLSQYHREAYTGVHGCTWDVADVVIRQVIQNRCTSENSQTGEEQKRCFLQLIPMRSENFSLLVNTYSLKTEYAELPSHQKFL